MPTLIPGPTVIPVPGNKIIREYVGAVNTQTAEISVAHMTSPAGWSEPGQTPKFAEYTLVLRGSMRVEHRGGVTDVNAGQAILTHPGEWIRYSTPGTEGADYIAICLPAFSPQSVHRDDG
jgi:mannose-6-phosphate isomerase-like protein (cupin superfamily)